MNFFTSVVKLGLKTSIIIQLLPGIVECEQQNTCFTGSVLCLRLHYAVARTQTSPPTDAAALLQRPLALFRKVRDFWEKTVKRLNVTPIMIPADFHWNKESGGDYVPYMFFLPPLSRYSLVHRGGASTEVVLSGTALSINNLSNNYTFYKVLTRNIYYKINILVF